MSDFNQPLPTKIVDPNNQSRELKINSDGSINISSFIPNDYDEVTIDRDVQDDPIFYNFYKSSVLIAKVQVTYNSNKSAVGFKLV